MKLRYESVGKGTPTIVFTHGLAARGATWNAQVRALSPRFRVVTWDLRGHGGSGSSDGPFTLHDLGEDLRTVFDEAGIEQAVVVGHSAGGVIAMRFALDYPERVSGLVLVGTSSECNQRAADFYENLAKLAIERGMHAVYGLLGLGNRGDVACQGDPATFAGVARCMGNLLKEPLTPELGRIHCPTLIIVGDRDFLGAGGSVILSRRIAGSQLRIVPERGHGIFLEDPEGFTTMLREFVEALPPASRRTSS